MSDKIHHEGIIQHIDPATGRVQVRIVQTSACAACKIAGHCNASESKVKLVDANGGPDTASLKEGQAVTIWAARSVAGRALLLAFGLPLALMVGVLIAVLLITGSEFKAAAGALGSLVPYYILLWFFRHRIARDVTFHLELNDE